MLPIPHLIVFILLCLAFSATRLLGVVGLVYLFYLNPFVCTPLVVFIVSAAFLIHRSKRSRHHD